MNDVIIIEPRSNESIKKGIDMLATLVEIRDKVDYEDKSKNDINMIVDMLTCMVVPAAAHALGFHSEYDLKAWLEKGNTFNSLLTK